MSLVSRFSARALLVAPIALMVATAPTLAQTPEDEMVITSTVHAGQGLTTKSIGLQVSDLNLADGSDYARLNRRVADAADKVCSRDGLWSKFENIEYSRCYKNAVSTAMAHVMHTAPASAVGSN